MNELIILPDLCNNHNEEWKSKVNEIYNTLDENKTDSSWWYFYGELESIVQYDIGTAINYVDLGYYKKQPDWCEIRGNKVTELHSNNIKYKMYYTGMIDCKIVGLDKPCVGFFWTTDESTKINLDGSTFPFWRQRGLVCLEEDKLAIELAYKKYKEKEVNI